MSERYVRVAKKLQAFEDESGATAVEYALIAAGIALAIIVSVGLIGDKLAAFFNSVSSAI